MTQNYKTACVFGGTGFIGRQVVRELAAKGYIIKIATRVPERAYFLKPCGAVGQVVPVQCQYTDPKSIAKAIEGSDLVVNTIGILFETGKSSTFRRIHTDLPASIAKASKKAGVKALIHISALGIESSNARYAHTKLEGEKAILSNFKTATILRPSVVFGEDDNFFNMFAKLASILPFLPLIGGGKTKFQPVFVGDVADAVMAAIDNPNTHGKIYELGGPDVVDFKGVYQRLFEHTKKKSALVPLPFFIAKIEAMVLQLLPNPLLTVDQVKSLESDTIVQEDALTLEDLDIEPTSMDVVLPSYLSRYRTGGRFAI